MMRGIVEYIDERDNGLWVLKVDGQSIGVFPQVNKEPTPGYDLLPGIRKGDEVEIETKKKGQWVNGVEIKKHSVSRSEPSSCGPAAGLMPRTSREEQEYINRRAALDKATLVAIELLKVSPIKVTSGTYAAVVDSIVTNSGLLVRFLNAQGGDSNG